MKDDAPILDFAVEGAEVVPYAAVPTLALKLHISSAGKQSIRSVLLRCQIQIESARRRYTPGEQGKLSDQFGEPQEWDRTLRNILWTNASVTVPWFVGSTHVDLPVPCSYDFNLAAVKYFDAMEDRDVPLCLLFSGTIFYAADGGPLQISQISWEKQAHYRLPVKVWRDMMSRYYPNTAWLELQKDVFDRLLDYKRRHALPTWEQAIEQLIDYAQQTGDAAELAGFQPA